MNEINTKLKEQITDAAGNVQYTFIAHWNIVNRLKNQYKGIKIVQIVLTALSTGGFLTSFFDGFLISSSIDFLFLHHFKLHILKILIF